MNPGLFAHARRGPLALAAALGLVFGVTAAPAQADSPVCDFTYTIRPQHSGMCLEVADRSQSAGALARLWDRHYGANQKFGFVFA
ncbi:RICIN domain-containing protein [Streptomyces sp. NK15101]|uniref:RICIN domain-containing protein n=1 Tax=Streptomyces sp. NK15101 TaxID=2873261 RepID=UPI001CEC1759|nr:RICIN domain-containing protein [Streptomyces sp. NK15101]